MCMEGWKLHVEKESVKITRAKEFTFTPFFKNAGSGTNGWKTANYKDSKRRAIALGDEEKQILKEREVLAIDSSEDTDEEDNVQPEEPP
ncbi:hypothetical protein AXG93_3661s1200 [Marchantia polymorpha subsp. ruderalis]|uniref:Uncharacterized protein n=1 Tax=Marchantia polymorpha subsp. ruderalis TaxID=1480154 RepID=A0A176VMC6_MARPO|nr:hypothetical protein AXG93_3661s1200 [Marchantia polymorpha subsp. ruderalis]